MPIPSPDDVLLNKGSVIERCLRRIREEFTACPDLDDFTHLDALTLNIERACQAAIDMAMHLAAKRHLGIPQSSAEAFNLLTRAGLIDAKLALALRAMTGFRNIAIHQYEDLNLDIVKHIAQSCHRDFVALCAALGIQIKEPSLSP